MATSGATSEARTPRRSTAFCARNAIARPTQLDEALAARPLTAEQLAEVESVAPRGAITGTRYPAAAMCALDSEKR
jgi:hypothetical protein